MQITELLHDQEWDSAFFKKLAKNDTGDAAGNQGGPLITKDLRQFFPHLAEATPEHPTVDSYINAVLIVNGVEVDRVITRYQIQTRGATRRPEARITENLTRLYNMAHAGDYLVIQRYVSELDTYRLILVRQGTPDFNILQSMVGTRKWGSVGEIPPVSEQDLEQSEDEEAEREQLPFTLFDPNAATIVTKTIRIARAIAFRQTLLREYNFSCCVCMSGLRSPSGLYELEAAHIVPRGRLGADDARNGLALCKRHHWAFDKGLFGIDNDRRIYIPERVRQIPENEALNAMLGNPIVEAETANLRASAEALEWHIENIVT